MLSSVPIIACTALFVCLHVLSVSSGKTLDHGYCHLFFPLLTFLSLRSLSPVSNSLCLLLLFSILLSLFPDLSYRSLPVAFSVILASFSLHFWESVLFANLSSSSWNVPSLQSPFCYLFLSALFTPTILLIQQFCYAVLNSTSSFLHLSLCLRLSLSDIVSSCLWAHGKLRQRVAR